MAKVKRVYVCTSCGTPSPKWQGQCTGCGEWNTLVEEVVVPETKQEQKQKAFQSTKTVIRPVALTEIKTGKLERLVTPNGELNRVLGGGIVPGSVILFGGQPGIGKSTLLLQVSLQLNSKVLYIAGEESEEQIKMRADRLSSVTPNVYILTETNTSKIFQHANTLQPDLMIVDSIQTIASPHLESTPGTVSQVRECASELQRYAKETGIPVFLIGHITKDGAIAGPKLLEHIVDCVLQFEGDRNYSYRILRTLKNRFGSTDELGIYQMQSTGLREVSNPSELLLSQKEEDLSGSAVAATLEGQRPILIETQALVSRAVYGTPQRSATGFDLRRLSMLLAVLEKRIGLPFGSQDVFLNLAGGIRVEDPAIDLAIVAALISSLEDVAVKAQIAFAGEIGLNGEIRAVNRIEQRIQEADRLGFEAIYVSKYNIKGIDQRKFNLEIKELTKVDELVHMLFR